MIKAILPIAAAVCLLASCASNTETTHDHAHDGANTEHTAGAEPANTVNNTITLTAGDDMKFSGSTFTVEAGKPVKLTLTHSGKMAKEVMGHNFVLLKPGSVVSDFANEAVNAKDTDYIPATSADKVVAKTKLLGAGETDTIEFTLTEKGEYPFLCSFPGHGGMMKGMVIVQ